MRHTRAAIEESGAAIEDSGPGPGTEDGRGAGPEAPRLRLLTVVEVEVGPEAVVARIWRESGSVTKSDKRKFVFMSSKTINKVFDLSKS